MRALEQETTKDCDKKKKKSLIRCKLSSPASIEPLIHLLSPSNPPC